MDTCSASRPLWQLDVSVFLVVDFVVPVFPPPSASLPVTQLMSKNYIGAQAIVVGTHHSALVCF